MSQTASALTRAHYRILLLLSAIQFINITDFMIVMPLSADIARDLHIANSDLGLLTGCYKTAAACSAIMGIWLWQHWQSRAALRVAVLGFGLGIGLAACAQNFPMLLTGRVITGIFSSAITTLIMVLMLENIPPAHRGFALSRLMQAFPLVSIFSIPISLELSHVSDWRVPFAALAVMSAWSIWMAWTYLPLNAEKNTQPAEKSVGALAPPMPLLTLRDFFNVYGTTALAAVSSFLLIPNLAAYLQYNLAVPRANFGWFYLCGGVATWLVLRYVGKMADNLGREWIAWAGTVVFIIVIYLGFVELPAEELVLPLFIALMVAMSLRNLAVVMFVSQFAERHQIAGLLAMNTAVQHCASALGSFLAVMLLQTHATGELTGIPTVAWLAIVLALTLPFGMRRQV